MQKFGQDKTIPSKKPDEDVVFLKQLPIHIRDRLARKTKDDVKFVKQLLLHPCERLKKKKKKKYSRKLQWLN